MEKRDLHDWIDDYLDGNLPEEERLELEQKMASDQAVQRQFQLQKDLRGAYQDSGRFELQETLANLDLEKFRPQDEPPQQSSKSWLKWILVLAALVVVSIAGLILWEKETTVFPPDKGDAIEIPDKLEEPAEKELKEETEKPPVAIDETEIKQKDQAEEKEQKAAPILYAAEDFAPHPSMEENISGVVMGESAEAVILQPKLADNFVPDNNGQVQLIFSGYAKDVEDESLVLLIFDNKNPNRPIHQFPLPTEQSEGDKYNFGIRPSLNLKYGLYYFSVETEDERPLGMGKFTVKK